MLGHVIHDYSDEMWRESSLKEEGIMNICLDCYDVAYRKLCDANTPLGKDGLAIWRAAVREACRD